MQIKKIALVTTLIALMVQFLSLHTWAIVQKRAVVAENYPEDILPDSIGLFVTPRGQQILAKGVPLLRQNGIQISKGAIATWNYKAKEAIDVDHLPITMAGHKTTLQTIQNMIHADIKADGSGQLLNFNNPLIALNVNGISYNAQITRLSLIPDLEETQFLHAANTFVVEAQVEASQLKLGVTSIGLKDSANLIFNNGDIGLTGLSITSAANSLPLMFTVPLAVSLDDQSHISIKALRIDDNLTAINTIWDFNKLTLPSFELIDRNDKNAEKDGINLAPWGAFSTEIKSHLPDIAKAAQAYLSQYVQEYGVGLVNDAFTSAIDVNTMFQEVNTMAPPGAPDGTTPVPYIWGLAPHLVGLTDQFLSTQINTFIEDPLSNQHVALPTAARAKSAPNLSAIDPSTYDIALQVDEGFINRLLQLSYLRGYFNSINEAGGKPLHLVVAPTITADGTTAADQLKMHIVLDYTNDPTGLLTKLFENLFIEKVLRLTFDMAVYVKSDTKTGEVILQEGPIDVNSVSVDPSGIKLPGSLVHGKVMDAIQSTMTKFNQDLAVTPSTLTTPLIVPNSIGGIPIVLKTVQADPSGNIMVYVEYGDLK
jgi:hypothetical protein